MAYWVARLRECDSGDAPQIAGTKHTFAIPRRKAPGWFNTVSPKNKGAGNAGCALHPRSRVRLCNKMVHTSIQGSGEHPTFPAQWLYGL